MLSPMVYSVAQVAAYLKDKLESDSLLSSLTVQGEVANLRTVTSGHSYFSLRGDGSSVRCVMFRGRSGQEYLEEGQEVLAGGTFSFYPPSGEANLQVAAVLPVGAGALALELARLRQLLESEGLFDPSRKRPLPTFPRVIGVVTSPSGAVWQDIQNVVRRRYPLAQLRLAPAAVQGDAAPRQVANAIAELNAERVAEVIIVARGGGSLEDLWSFNSEEVARAIFASGIPVVSGVGHETDFTIADDVADRRAPTPSAAAELVTPDRAQLLANVQAGTQQAKYALTNLVTQRRNRVEMLGQRVKRLAPDVALLRRRVDDLQDRATTYLIRANDRHLRDVATLAARLAALEPSATLRRGYAVVSLARNGEVVTSPHQVSDGEALSVTVAGGTMDAVGGGAAGGSDPNRRGLEPAVSRIEPTPSVEGVAEAQDQPALSPKPARRRKSSASPPAMRPLI